MINGLERGGAEAMLVKLTDALADYQWKSTVISLTTKGTLADVLTGNGIEVSALGIRHATWLKGALALRRRVRQHAPDIVQAWQYHSNALTAAALTERDRCEFPLLWNVRHSLHDLRREKVMTRAVIRAGIPLSKRPRGIVYNSVVSRRQHFNLGYADDNGLVIPNGFDTELIRRKRAEGLTFRREFGIPDAAKVVGMVARLHPMKDHSGFLRATELVTAQHPDAFFVLVGRGVTALDRTATGGLQNVILVEEQADVIGWLSSFDVYVSSSAWGEAFSNALAEAMATELPSVVTDVGDSRMIVGECGFVVPPSNPEMLASSIGAVLDMSVEVRQNLGRSARARVTELFGLSSVAQRYAELYNETIGNGGHH